MNHINNDQSECINVIIFQMIQKVLHKLENVMVKLTLHIATCLYNQQKGHLIIMSHIKNNLSECINVIIFKITQEVLHKLENATVKLTFHTATCPFIQQTSSYNNKPHQKLMICPNA